MSDSPRSIQAAALEIPVTIQGSKSAEGVDQRELFVETTTTTLVFENGAVVSLKSKLAPGQCVFLRNEKTGKEILCKVLEWREQGECRYADLEFTAYEPDFWGRLTDDPQAQDERSEAQKRIDEAVANLTAKPASEGLAATALPASESPAGGLKASTPAPTATVDGQARTSEEPPQEADRMKACEGKPSGASAEESTDTPGDATRAETPEAEVVQSRASQAANAQDSDGTQPEAATAEASQEDETSGEGDSQATVPRKRTRMAKPVRPPNFKARKIAAAISVTVAVAVITFQIYEWRARYRHGAAAPARSTSPAIVEDSGHASTAPAATQAVVEKSEQPTAKSENNANLSKKEAAVSAKAMTAQGSSAHPGSVSAAVGEAADKRGLSESGPRTRVRTQYPEVNAPSQAVIVPAKIVSQPQPPFPYWAKGLDIGTVVELDAVIDANGNLAATTPLSGPRILQHAAERAVALWVFEPATRDGKPVPSHMILTVEFQR